MQVNDNDLESFHEMRMLNSKKPLVDTTLMSPTDWIRTLTETFTWLAGARLKFAGWSLNVIPIVIGLEFNLYLAVL